MASECCTPHGCWKTPEGAAALTAMQKASPPAMNKAAEGCFCRECQDNRVLAIVDECGGSYFAARKQVALETAVYKAQLKNLSSPDPQVRELARDYLRKGAM
jgi:hypothetical protein